MTDDDFELMARTAWRIHYEHPRTGGAMRWELFGEREKETWRDIVRYVLASTPPPAAPAPITAEDVGEWTPTRWWQIADREGRIYCQTTDGADAREAFVKDRATNPGLILQRLYERTCTTEEWREVPGV